jgi:hypothetical protein
LLIKEIKTHHHGREVLHTALDISTDRPGAWSLRRGIPFVAAHKIELLPNVHINERLELSGFKFECAGCDVAYEILNETSSNFNDKILHVLQNMDEYKTDHIDERTTG